MNFSCTKQANIWNMKSTIKINKGFQQATEEYAYYLPGHDITTLTFQITVTQLHWQTEKRLLQKSVNLYTQNRATMGIRHRKQPGKSKHRIKAHAGWWLHKWVKRTKRKRESAQHRAIFFHVAVTVLCCHPTVRRRTLGKMLGDFSALSLCGTYLTLQVPIWHM